MADYDRQYIKKQIADIVPATPTAGSLQDILSKAAGGNTFDKATDSLEMLSDKVGAYAGTSGAGATESVKAQLDLVKAKTDLITAGAVSVSGVGTTTTGVIVQYGATGTPTTVQITTGAANTFSAWTQLDAAVSANSWLSGVTFSIAENDKESGSYCIEIGTGANPDEVAICRHSIYFFRQSNVGFSPSVVFTLPIPIKIASGTRLTARVSYSTGTINTVVGVSMYRTLES